MSVKIIDMVWERYPENATHAELLVALAVADWANDSGEGIYPSLATLSRKGRQSESSARRHIKHMLERGWLLRVNRGTGGRSVTNEYRISPEWIKGVNLTPFHVEPEQSTEEGPKEVREAESEGSRGIGNPSTALTGLPNQNPSKLEPFAGTNPSSLSGFSGERVSNEARKGVTAMTPDPSEPKNSGARAPARERARATPEPDRTPDPELARRWWVSTAIGAVLDAGSLRLPGNEPLWNRNDQLFPDTGPKALRGTAAVMARELVRRLADEYTRRELAGEKRMDLLVTLNRQALEDLRPTPAASAA